MITLTYGQLPDREVFDTVFYSICGRTFEFVNDKRVGTCELLIEELWSELNDAVYDGNDNASDWASCVLYSLGIEWV
jgi:hypothetical protein